LRAARPFVHNGTVALSEQPLLYPPPQNRVNLRRDGTLDIYSPAIGNDAQRPAVVIATGYRDAGFQAFVGCRFKDMLWTTSWARLLASAGAVTFTYTTEDPAAGFAAVVTNVRDRADEFGIDRNLIGIFGSSGHGPVALSALMTGFPVDVACVSLAYAYTLDLNGARGVADAAATFRFGNACAGKSISDMRADVSLLIARAGKDEMPQLNAATDAFIAAALERNAALTVVNHPEGPHAFDLTHDSAQTRSIIAAIISFLAG
jgi:hypothetical protein